MKVERHKFLESISLEMEVQSRRVRQLIGDSHWGHDGRHKEALLIEMIRKHLPYGFGVGTGFVISDRNSTPVSREQDLIIYDRRHSAPLFESDGMIVVLSETVVAAISVKTKFGSDEIDDSIKTLLTAREVCAVTQNGESIWCGAFFYELGLKTSASIYNSIGQGILSNQRTISPFEDGQHVPNGPDVFCHCLGQMYTCDYFESSSAQTANFQISGFDVGALAAAGFLALLLDALSVRLGEQRPSVTSMILNELEGTALIPGSWTPTPSDHPQMPRHRQKRNR